MNILDVILASTSIIGALVAIGALIFTIHYTSVARRNLLLVAYQYAIQEGILDLKRVFAEHDYIFKHQMVLDACIEEHINHGKADHKSMEDYIPEYMQEDIPAFLAFAGGMWRLSYVWSVWNRGKALGLSEGERNGLKNEMLLWLQGVPGFYDVYKFHTKELQAHNPDFLKFLRDVYEDESFQRKREIHDNTIYTDILQKSFRKTSASISLWKPNHSGLE